MIQFINQLLLIHMKLTLVLILLSFGGIFNLAFQPTSSILSISDLVDKPEFNMWLEFICVSVIILEMMLFELYIYISISIFIFPEKRKRKENITTCDVSYIEIVYLVEFLGDI